jgi:hypothetical protein
MVVKRKKSQSLPGLEPPFIQPEKLYDGGFLCCKLLMWSYVNGSVHYN